MKKRGIFVKRVFITRYALEKGIIEIHNVRYVEDTRSVYLPKDHALYIKNACERKPYWHYTEKEAIAHADILRKRKIKRLQNQIKKFKSMKWE